MKRRSFLSSILLACTAPVIVHASSLMKITPIWYDKDYIEYNFRTNDEWVLSEEDFIIEGWLPADNLTDPFYLHVTIFSRFDGIKRQTYFVDGFY